MTAAAKPGRREGGGTMDCRARDLVLMAGGATRAAAVATWALVRARGDGIEGDCERPLDGRSRSRNM